VRYNGKSKEGRGPGLNTWKGENALHLSHEKE